MVCVMMRRSEMQVLSVKFWRCSPISAHAQGARSCPTRERCRARARGGWRTALGRGRRSGISWPRIARTPALTACPRPPGARRAAAAGPRSGARPGEPAGGARAAGARETGHGGPRVVRTGSEPPRAPARAPKRAPSRRCGLPPRAACSASFGAACLGRGVPVQIFVRGGFQKWTRVRLLLQSTVLRREDHVQRIREL